MGEHQILKTQQKIADASGIGQTTVGRIIRGETNPTSDNVRRLAKAFGVPTARLYGEAVEQQQYPVKQQKFRRIWVVGKGAGGNLPERIWTDGDHPVGATDEYGDVLSSDPQAFIVRVVDSSMVPKYTPGEYALVEPNTEADIEDDVLVRLTNGQTMIKRLVGRRGTIRLASYNNVEVLSYSPDEIAWMYYVPYPVPAKKIKPRT